MGAIRRMSRTARQNNKKVYEMVLGLPDHTVKGVGTLAEMFSPPMPTSTCWGALRRLRASGRVRVMSVGGSTIIKAVPRKKTATAPIKVVKKVVKTVTMTRPRAKTDSSTTLLKVATILSSMQMSPEERVSWARDLLQGYKAAG
jgi:hypothetical protein